MAKFSGVLICTDLDGTLFRNDKTVSEENLRAIEYFKSQGGYFAFVTGRMPSCAKDVYEIVKPNAPIGCINGGGLYDFEKKDYIWAEKLPSEAISLVEEVDKKLPKVGIQPNAFYDIYFSRENDVMEYFRTVTGVPNLVCDYHDVKDELAKVLFGTSEEDEMNSLIKLLNEHPLADRFTFIRSERTLYEILPKGIGKGTAISKLCEHLGVDKSKSVAIGDYYNDISMFNAAGVGIAVSNACDEAKDAADFVTVSNEENAIAQVINDIENGKYIGD